jgi:hypothetical protein
MRDFTRLEKERRRLTPWDVNQPSAIETAKPQRLILVNLLA